MLKSVVAILSVLLLTAGAQAGSVPIDFNALNLNVSVPSFAGGNLMSYSGDVQISTDQNSLLFFGVDGTNHGAFNSSHIDVEGNITISNGVVVGGEVTFGAKQASAASYDYFTVDMTPGVGGLTRQPGSANPRLPTIPRPNPSGGDQPAANPLGLVAGTTIYTLNALTQNGRFDHSSYAGTSLAGMNWDHGIPGFLFTFSMNLVGGVDSNVDVFASSNVSPVPLPSAVYAGVTLLAVIGAIRVYRRRAQRA